MLLDDRFCVGFDVNSVKRHVRARALEPGRRGAAMSGAFLIWVGFRRLFGVSSSGRRSPAPGA
jgi:hypothetical protein